MGFKAENRFVFCYEEAFLPELRGNQQAFCARFLCGLLYSAEQAG